MLSDGKVLEAMRTGKIKIKPFERKHLGPNSYDLAIHDIVKHHKIANSQFSLAGQAREYYTWALPNSLRPGQTWTCATSEVVGCKENTLGILSLRSNASRTGLIFQFSHLLDTGFEGVLSFSVHNPTPETFIIPKGWRPLQIMFMHTCGKVSVPYDKRTTSKNTKQKSINEVNYKHERNNE